MHHRVDGERRRVVIAGNREAKLAAGIDGEFRVDGDLFAVDRLVSSGGEEVQPGIPAGRRTGENC